MFAAIKRSGHLGEVNSGCCFISPARGSRFGRSGFAAGWGERSGWVVADREEIDHRRILI